MSKIIQRIIVRSIVKRSVEKLTSRKRQLGLNMGVFILMGMQPPVPHEKYCIRKPYGVKMGSKDIKQNDLMGLREDRVETPLGIHREHSSYGRKTKAKDSQQRVDIEEIEIVRRLRQSWTLIN